MKQVLIIGAGASGLMAARELRKQGIDFLILESTEHVGGRAKTLMRNPHIEFGPEFLHGETPLTDQLLEEYKLPYYDLKFDYHLFKDGKLSPLPDFWERLCAVIKDIKLQGKDMPFSEYLEKFDKHSEIDKDISKTFVEGFDAADLTRMSTRALKDMPEVACDPGVRKMRRPLHGYGELMGKIAEEVFPHICFTYVVEVIEWKKNYAIVRGYTGKEKIPFEIEAEKVIDTVSVGVLRKQKISPRPKELDHFLNHVEMGQVVKLVAELDPEFFHVFENNSFPFISAPDLCFSAWWTTTPIHTNTITAWAGGERAIKLEGKSEDDLRSLFVQELATISSQAADSVSSWIKNIYYHDWSDDNSFLGAYSYPTVAEHSIGKTQTAFEDTLYFAGEAFHEEFSGTIVSGTIEGALITGKAAALKIIFPQGGHL